MPALASISRRRHRLLQTITRASTRLFTHCSCAFFICCLYLKFRLWAAVSRLGLSATEIVYLYNFSTPYAPSISLPLTSTRAPEEVKLLFLLLESQKSQIRTCVYSGGIIVRALENCGGFLRFFASASARIPPGTVIVYVRAYVGTRNEEGFTRFEYVNKRYTRSGLRVAIIPR